MRKRTETWVCVGFVALTLVLAYGAAATTVQARTLSREQVAGLIYEAADDYGVSAAQLLRVAECESHLDDEASGDHGTSAGVFQWHFEPDGGSIWWSTPQGRAGESPWNARSNVRAAAWIFSVHPEWRRFWSCW